MKIKGRLTALILVLITNCIYIVYYFSRDTYIHRLEIYVLLILLVLAWYSGKQFDKIKILEEKERVHRKDLQRNYFLFQKIFEKAPIGISLIDQNGKPVMSNRKLQEMLGYSPLELHSMPFSKFSDAEDAEINMELLKDLLAGKIDYYQIEKRYIRKDGQIVWGNVTSTLFPSEKNEPYLVIGMVDDITERKKSEQKLQMIYEEMEYLSIHDGLTNIANRRYFNNHLFHEWQRAERHKEPISLIMIDIDFFKEFNDTYGHLQGDKCLKQVANLLQTIITRPTDLAARYGGEEFAVILPGTSLNDAAKIAGEICNSIHNIQIPHRSSHVSKYISASIGVSTIVPSDQTTYEDLIIKTDKALYFAKEKGRNRVNIFYDS